MKRLSDTLTYRGIASEAVFTVPPVVGEFKRTVPNYLCTRNNSGRVVPRITRVVKTLRLSYSWNNSRFSGLPELLKLGISHAADHESATS